MNIALITAFVAIMLVPLGTAWIIALNKAPVRVAYMQLTIALTIEVVILVAIHVAFYASRSWDNAAISGFVMMYIFGGGTIAVFIAAAYEYIDQNHDELEPPKAPKLTKFKSGTLR